MKRMLRKIWKLMKLSVGAWAVATLLLCSAAPAFAQSPEPPIAKSPQPPAAAPSAVKPSEPAPAPVATPEFLKRWDRLQTILELRQEQQRKRDAAIGQIVDAQIALGSLTGQANELAQQVRSEIPKGYDFDPATRTLKPSAPPPSAPSAEEKKEPPKP